ncbi:cysteine peptidase family C39 domain-containing protein [Roseiconus lacunae]|uniref:peptidase C39 n=1 Tax=Roseiconus lacunae TaxID=2605694 RepID=UPI001E5487A0|nr:peptidase C39 [Roseiconus lacunae]MCD0459033.1 peptidase C39 [Roseiconus lacunae]
MFASDLTVAIAVMSIACAATVLITARLTSKLGGQKTMLCLAAATLAMIYFLFYATGQLFWAKLVPHSAAIIYTNFACLFAAVATGAVWRLPNTPHWRRGILAVALSGGTIIIVFWPLLSIALRPPQPGSAQWKDGVALQTTWANCSPAAAATLLRAEGIAVTEADMVPVCLTDASGTPTLGLYRGIKLVAQRHDAAVEVVDSNLSRLLAEDDWPVLLAVKLPYGVDDRRYADQWGWIPGMGHSVVALGRGPGGEGILIGDPSRGLEIWAENDLQILWHGKGIRLTD